ncbi:hypothetical protein [Natrinema sp. H-ect4]|uniref:hypothetical protein n=1 Tax=Natrinema sp. H-ect4 TaxID=3242699 RepID=UPI0035A83622
MTVEELWQERLTEARLGIGRGLQPKALAERYGAETKAEIKELTIQATKECLRGGHSTITLDDLDLAEEKLESANNEVVTDGGRPVGDAVRGRMASGPVAPPSDAGEEESSSGTEHTCYACDDEPTAIVHGKSSRGPLPVCDEHLEKLNKIGVVDDSEMRSVDSGDGR